MQTVIDSCKYLNNIFYLYTKIIGWGLGLRTIFYWYYYYYYYLKKSHIKLRHNFYYLSLSFYIPR